MCGICGIARARPETEQMERTVHGMVQTIRHRGPDGQGIEVFNPLAGSWGLAFGHARLAVIDLSNAGRQPMSNEDGTVWVILNGEIYNFQELRTELEAKGHRFRSRTDTEVIVHLYEELGPACVKRLNGMFAFALYDGRRRRSGPNGESPTSGECLLLARDPLGIKPLYYCSLPSGFAFGSEIKAILSSGLYSVDVDWQAVSDYFTYLYVPNPQTMFKDIKQVPPAHVLTLDLVDGSCNLEPYWQVQRSEEIESLSERELKARTRELLADSVGRQLVSDVPVGVFLSGGVDSTIVTGLAREHDAALRTFTAVFQGSEFDYYNEQEPARAVSRHLGTEHHEMPVVIGDPMDVLGLVEKFDQPFGNPTFYLMYLISHQARQHVTVALTGAGGDELFAGYPRYRAAQLARRLRWIPQELLKLANKPMAAIRDSYRTMSLRRAREFLEGLDRDAIRQFLNWTYFMDEDAKSRLLTGQPGANGGAGGFAPSERVLRSAMERSPLADEENRVLHLDVQTFLVDNLLEYTDKMSMAVALETRVPLLDQRFVEFSLNVPYAHKLRNGQGKALLRETFSDFFPPEGGREPKRGFNVPLAHWILRSFDGYFEASQLPGHALSELLGPDTGITWREGILDWGFIQALREQHRRGRRDNSYELFAVIMFDVWWRRYVLGSHPSIANRT